MDRETIKFADLQPISIHFDGSISKREVNPGREYTMNLQFARPGDIVVAKIDLKNGAVAIVPEGWENVVVTGHFAVYEPNRAKLVPEFFHRVIQTTFFKAHLWRNKVGAEGRKEVKLDFFESQLIPIPPLQTQRAILARWHAAQSQTAAANQRVEALDQSVHAEVLAALGYRTRKSKSPPKVFAASWSVLERWGVSSSQQALIGVNLSAGKFTPVGIGSLATFIQYGTSEKANATGKGVPVLRMNNIKGGQLVPTDIKHVPLTEREAEKLRLVEGDILFNRTNSKELVGKCAVFHLPETFVFASYLIRVRLDPTRAIPDYAAFLLNGPLGRQQIAATSRQIIGQANINSEELRNLLIPLPPLEIQRQLVERITAARAEIARERAAAAQLARDTAADVEALILGNAKP